METTAIIGYLIFHYATGLMAAHLREPGNIVGLFAFILLGPVALLLVTWHQLGRFQRAALGLAVALLVFGCADDYATQQTDAKKYCGMVQQYNETRGEGGWPDYRGTFDEECAR